MTSCRLALACLLFAVAPACMAGPEVKEVTFVWGGLRIEFAQPMRTWVGDVDTLEQIKITPPLTCAWSWDEDTLLSCIPRYGHPQPPKATAFEVQIAEGLLWSQQEQPLPATLLHVESGRPEAYARVDDWTDEGWPVFALHVDQRVTQDELKRVLALRDHSGEPVAFALAGTPEFHGTAFRLTPVSDERRDLQLELRILPGLRSLEGPLPGVEDQVLASALAGEQFGLRAVRCPGASGTGRLQCRPLDTVELEFSHPLDDAALHAWQAELPAGLSAIADGEHTHHFGRNDDSIARRPGSRVRLRLGAVRSRVRLRLPASLLSEDGQALPAQSVTIRSGDHHSHARFEPRWLLARPGQRAAPQIDGYNLRAGSVRQWTLGAEYQQRHRAWPDHRSNRPRAIRLPSTPRNLWQHGGLAVGELEGIGGYQVAWSQWRVVVGRADSQLVAWVSDWDTGEAVGSAQVELLTLDAGATPSDARHVRVLADARSDHSGVAVLPIATAEVADLRGLWVRVEHPDGRSVMPLAQTLPGSPSAWRWQRRASEARVVNWGITDRPLYRPGERVRFRLWVRQRSGNRLLAAAEHAELELGLVQSWRWSATPLLVWSASADAFGGIEGEITLPATLQDDRYCIQLKDGSPEEGACFTATRFDAAELWTELQPRETFARGDETVLFDLEAGFFSGGPAVGAQAELSTLLTPMRLQHAYPQHHGFEFIDPYAGTAGHNGESFRSDPTPRWHTDANGRTEVSLSLTSRIDDEAPIPFGTLEITAMAGFSGQFSATSAPAELRFSRHRRYVGLRIDHPSTGAGAPAHIESRVIDEQGVELIDRDVDIVVQGEQRDAEDGWEVLGSCTLTAGSRGPCGPPLEAGKRYRFLASSIDAAPAGIIRHIGHARVISAEPTPELRLVELDRNGTARFALQQPFARAAVLFTLQHGEILRHWVEHVAAGESEHRVAVDAAMAPGVSVVAVVVELPAEALRTPHTVAHVAELEIPIEAAAPASAIELRVPESAAPGETVEIGILNPRDRPVQLTLTVIDDGLLARVHPEDMQAYDPGNEHWLGGLERWNTAAWFGFVGFNGGAERYPQAARAGRTHPAHFDGASRLDRIEVTGSRITAADVFTRGAAIDRALLGADAAGDGIARPRLRTRFVDTAHWQPSLLLGPGESTALQFRLPDNLTRWRVIAWAADADDGFARNEATFTAELAIETRLNAPRRVFAGDTASVNASARNRGEGSQQVRLELTGEGAGADFAAAIERPLAANALLTLRATATPGRSGRLESTASASAAIGRDAVLRATEVAAAEIRERRVQAALLGDDPLTFELPPLPETARAAQLQLQIGRIDSALAAHWTAQLRDYPHRCWEQTLSRGLAAALAMADPERSALWPEAAADLREALDDAVGFVADDGLYQFFSSAHDDRDGHLLLSAYTLQAFEQLERLQHPLPGGARAALRRALETAWSERWETGPETRQQWEELAVLAGALGADAGLAAEHLQRLDGQWPELSWYARAQLTRALTTTATPIADEAIARLRAAGQQRGLRRTIDTGYSSPAMMGSPSRDQCAVLAALAEFDRGEEGDAATRALLYGLLDQYAGGSSSHDTQAAAQCLIAIDAVTRRFPPLTTQPSTVRITAADQQPVTLAVDPEAHFDIDAPLPRSLQLQRNSADHRPISVIGSLSYTIDADAAPPVATGITIERTYSVWRHGDWQPLAELTLEEGEWLRVTVTVGVPAWRHFVAITDPVPGGLSPEDLALAGIGGIDLQRAATPGSPWFDSRRTTDTEVYLYAEQLPPGSHPVHYYAQARFAGDYLATPATAELMYGPASVARTAAIRLRIEAASR
jgi:uncharacterized protein YfaS (alpha-2-macroglobulin family)